MFHWGLMQLWIFIKMHSKYFAPAFILKRKKSKCSFYICEQSITFPNEILPYLEQPDTAALKCLNWGIKEVIIGNTINLYTIQKHRISNSNVLQENWSLALSV